MKKKLFFIENSQGQAIFELVAFLPLLVLIFTIMVTVGNSINVSINQQKVTRRYFYYLLKGNSTAPTQEDLKVWHGEGRTLAGMSALGFRAKEKGEFSYAPCFKFNTLFTGDSGETCDEPLKGEAQSTFVRIFTFYGICGETYIVGQNYFKNYHNFPYIPGRPDVMNAASCHLR
ncbi:MAG: hypothetical protein OXB92_17140 [Acidimicrobiaceae bacterium]|nr:hypothetical protein [Acidimicrobiaceae bacterium]